MQAQPLAPPPEDPAPWRRLLQNHPQEIIFSATLILALIARMSSFSLAYALDDYGFFSDDHALAMDRPQMLSQGRFGLVLLIDVLRWLGLNVSGDYVLGAALLTLSLVWLAFASTRAAGINGNTSIGAAAAFIIVLHPYQAEYFTYRASLLVFSAPLALAALVLCLNLPTAKRIMFSAVLLLLATSMWQEALVLFVTASLFAASCRFVCGHGQILHRARAAAREGNLPANMTAAFAAFLLYLPMFGVSLRLSSWSPESRTQLIPLSELPLRAKQIWEVVVNVLFKSEPIFPHGPKLLLLGLFLVSGLIAACLAFGKRERYAWQAILVSILVFPAALLASSMAPIVLSHGWWPVPRVLIAVAWFWAFLAVCSLVWLTRYAGRRVVSTGVVVLSVVTLAMIGLNNQVLTDELRVNIRDREQMNRIIGRLEATPGFRNVSRLMIVGGSWGYASPILAAQGDLNISAFYPAWSKLPLAREISGYGFQTVDAPGEVSTLHGLCATGEKWPSPESMHIVGQAAVVCLTEIP